MELELDERKGEKLEINVYKKGTLQPKIIEQILSGRDSSRRVIYIGGTWDDENDEMVDPLLTISIR